MPHSWKIIDTGIASAKENMAIDAALLENLSMEEQPILHFYDWEGSCATYGHFINPMDFLNPEGIAARKVEIAQRPTGGGIIFHVTDFAFSVLIPANHTGYSVNTLDNYAFVNTRIIQALLSFFNLNGRPFLMPDEKVALDEPSRHFCMAKPTKYDVMMEGRKVSGGAQRRTKHGFLHQGTIALAFPAKDFLQVILKPGTCVFESMQKHTYPLLNISCTTHELKEARQEIRAHLINSFQVSYP